MNTASFVLPFDPQDASLIAVACPFSHAAIVAREFGIPLVDGTLDAMREIPDGTPIVVDGSAGIVYFEDYSRKDAHRGQVMGNGRD